MTKAEMMGWSKRSGTYYIILILTHSAAIPVAFSLSNPVILLATAFLTLIIWGLEIYRHRAVQRLGAYIEVVLETNLNGLGWVQISAADREKRTNMGYLFNSLPFLSLALLSLVASGAFWFVSGTWIRVSWIWWIGSSVFLIVLTGIIVSVFRIYSYRKRMNNFFLSEFQKS